MYEFSTLAICPIYSWESYLTCCKGAGKFFNFHGLPEARLNRDDSVYVNGHSTNRRTWFIKLISILLFSAPDFHLENLQKIWVDGMMHKAVWEEGLKKMTEWQEFILLYVSQNTNYYYYYLSQVLFLHLLTFKSTVMLNANVAFLSIQSVDVNLDPYRSPAQTSSYCSIVTSIGSIIIGLILVRQNRTKSSLTETTFDMVSDFIDQIHLVLTFHNNFSKISLQDFGNILGLA